MTSKVSLVLGEGGHVLAAKLNRQYLRNLALGYAMKEAQDQGDIKMLDTTEQLSDAERLDLFLSRSQSTAGIGSR